MSGVSYGMFILDLVTLMAVMGFMCPVYSLNCSDHCTDCSSDGRCRHCEEGFYGVNCTACSDVCRNRMCVLDLCVQGCVEGRYGYSCESRCPYCPAGCDQWTGGCYALGDTGLLSPLYTGREESLHAGYQLLIAVLLVSGLCVTLIIAVYVKARRRQNIRLQARRRVGISQGHSEDGPVTCTLKETPETSSSLLTSLLETPSAEMTHLPLQATTPTTDTSISRRTLIPPSEDITCTSIRTASSDMSSLRVLSGDVSSTLNTTRDMRTPRIQVTKASRPDGTLSDFPGFAAPMPCSARQRVQDNGPNKNTEDIKPLLTPHIEDVRILVCPPSPKSLTDSPKLRFSIYK